MWDKRIREQERRSLQKEAEEKELNEKENCSQEKAREQLVVWRAFRTGYDFLAEVLGILCWPTQEELSSSAEVEEEVGVNETKEECGVAKAAKHVTFADEVMEKVTVELTKVFAEAETETVSAAKDPVKEDVVAEETSGEVSAAVEISQASETKETKQTKEPKKAAREIAAMGSESTLADSGGDSSTESVISVSPYHALSLVRLVLGLCTTSQELT
nr:hypothetical protein BaRGS_028809 [Batillaria attramentaria]